MKKKLFDRRGAAIELAMLMIVVCFSLSILLLSTTLLLNNRKIRAEHRMEQSIALEQIGQEFLSAVVAGQVDESWLPAGDNGLTDEPIHRHSWEVKSITEATCTTAGSKLLICTDTDCREEKTVKIPIAEHNWESDNERSQEYEACKSNGIYYEICSYCPAEKVTFIPAHLGIDDTITKEATCREAGEKFYTCYYCGNAVTETIPVSDEHNWGEDNKCVDCGLVRPIITYSLTAYRTAEKTVRYEVAVIEPAAEITPVEPTEDKRILKITILFDEVDGTYLVTEWTKNDRS